MSESDTKPSPLPRGSESEDDEHVDEDEHAESERLDDAHGDGSGTESSEGAAEPPSRTSRPRRFLARVARARVLLPLSLICVLLAGIALLGINWYRDDALHAARGSAVDAAREYAVALTSYDYEELRGDFGKVSSKATGRFAEEYEKVSSNLTKLIRKHQAVSKGNVVAAGLVNGDRDRAVVLLFVDQTITNTNIDKPRVDRNRMRMTLLHKDDDWLIDNVELL